jgi:hypothetical protein
MMMGPTSNSAGLQVTQDRQGSLHMIRQPRAPRYTYVTTAQSGPRGISASGSLAQDQPSTNSPAPQNNSAMVALLIP